MAHINVQLLRHALHRCHLILPDDQLDSLTQENAFLQSSILLFIASSVGALMALMYFTIANACVPV